MKLIYKIMTATAITCMIVSIPLHSFAATYKDVSSSHWVYSAVNWATEHHVVTGYPDGNFKPTQAVSEEEFLSMLIRAYGDINDNSPSPHWSDKYYVRATQLNYPVSGKRTAIINRTTVAELIAGTQGKNYSGNDAIKFLLANGLANGKIGSTVAGYKGNDSLTRAEAVTFIQNVLKHTADQQLQVRPVTPSNPAEINDGKNINPPPIEEANPAQSLPMDKIVVGDFHFDPNFIKLAKMLFINNLKEQNGQVTFTVPKGATAEWVKGGSPSQDLTPRKLYTFDVGKGKGSISIVYRDTSNSLYHDEKANKQYEYYDIILDPSMDAVGLYSDTSHAIIAVDDSTKNLKSTFGTVPQVIHLAKKLK